MFITDKNWNHKSMNKRPGKQLVVCSSNGILINNKKEHTQKHDCISKTLCWLKTALDKRVYSVWFHLHQVQELMKALSGDRGGAGSQLRGKRHKGTFWVMEMFYNYIIEIHIFVYICNIFVEL